MTGLLVGVVFLLLMAGAALWWLGRRQRQATGLPPGEVIYEDVGIREEVRQPLISRRYGLVGRPDYLVMVQEGSRRLAIPVEVKSRARPAQPFRSHVLQLATYCLLVEDLHKVRPPYGLIRYADATVRIPFTEELRAQVLAAADAIRRARTAPDVPRQHQDPRRCAGCSYRKACGQEALV